MLARRAPLGWLGASGLGLVYALSASTDARAGDADSDKKACVSAYGRSQELRREGKLRDARAALVTCSQPRCPEATRADCVPWLADVESALPSVVLEAHDSSGRELTDVAVEVDGAELVSRLDGKSVEIDPGVHSLRWIPAGGQPVEERVTIRQGEKDRRLTVVLGGPPGSDTATAAPAREGGDSVPPPVWVLGAVGLVGLATFTTLAIITVREEDRLRDACAPRCKESDVQAIRTKQIIGDVSLGVGIVSLGVAAGLWFLRPKTPDPRRTGRPALSIDAGVSPSGAAAWIRGPI